MRVTSSMYYESLYGSNNTKLNKQLFDVNKQIASGLSIQYASDDVATFTETMRLDNEIVSLGQIKKSTESGYKVANQTDTVLNEFDTSLNRMRTLLVSAANGTNDETSLNAIAAELRGVESNLKSLANTSINGQYLFSGSAVDVKPIDEDGVYRGNNESMKAFVGSHNQQQYNLSGGELFLGEEKSVRKFVTSNVNNDNLIAKYPSLQSDKDKNVKNEINAHSTIREIMGDTDDVIDNVNAKHIFYLRGTTSEGKAFNEKIKLKDTDTIDHLLTRIGNAYGNTSNLKQVNVSINDAGQISVEDKKNGSSKLDFHLVGAVDFSGGDKADVDDISELDGAETSFKEIMNPTNPPAKDLFVVEFVKSSLKNAKDAPANINGLLYDKTEFKNDGSRVIANVPQIERDTNAFASSSTKISEVADLTQGTDGTLDGTSFVLSGKNIYGKDYDVTIDLKSDGSSFNVNGKDYDIYDVSEVRKAVPADEMTYHQLMDIVNMVVTDNLPADEGTHTNADGTPYSAAQEYDYAVYESKFSGNTYLTYDGKMAFEELNNPATQATIALYDSNSGNFAQDANASVLAFNANNSLTISDPKTDFFKTIDRVITSVENYSSYPDAGHDEDGNVGIENSIRMLDDLQEHLLRSHSKIGAYSNSLTQSLERTELLDVSTRTLRSSVVDTDLAKASLELTQLTNNYEAMLSIVGKISKLSLVNYL